MNSVSLSDSEMQFVMELAKPLTPEKRSLFLQRLFARLALRDRTTIKAAADMALQGLMHERAEVGLERRINIYGIASGHIAEDYRERLDFELKVIEGMNYPGYFLIVSDFYRDGAACQLHSRHGMFAQLITTQQSCGKDAKLHGPILAGPRRGQSKRELRRQPAAQQR
jgi:hypothetical protein